MAGLVLKKYQEHALEALTVFLRAARERGAKAAFEDSGYGYSREPFGEVPCVCLRIPTGGGKTLLASHAIVRMAKEWLETRADAPTALWLTPSDTIRSQTLKALQTPGHPYREALENAYGQRFQICDLENAVAISPHDWGRQAVIVVATIQSFRIEETGLRNVYAFNETFEPHFKGQPPHTLAVLRDDLTKMGVARRVDRHESEDHVSALCDVMRFLIVGDADTPPAALDLQSGFFSRHIAPWYAQLGAAVIGANQTDFYKHVAHLLREFFAIETAAFDIA